MYPFPYGHNLRPVARIPPIAGARGTDDQRHWHLWSHKAGRSVGVIDDHSGTQCNEALRHSSYVAELRSKAGANTWRAPG